MYWCELFHGCVGICLSAVCVYARRVFVFSSAILIFVHVNVGEFVNVFMCLSFLVCFCVCYFDAR